MLDADNAIKKAVLQRAMRLQYERVYGLIGGKPFILAGGALCGDDVHDFDLYPYKQNPYNFDDIDTAMSDTKPVDVSEIARTRNALTVMLGGGQCVQFCTYLKLSLVDLVTSFDYAHVQVGVLFPGGNEPPHIENVFYTDAFVVSNVTRCTSYTGSEYPTSSIIRALKYHKRGKMPKMSAGRSIVHAMADVIDRGFTDYNDFKDQLDAIDLGLPECAEARLLYDACCKAGLVGGRGHG